MNANPAVFSSFFGAHHPVLHTTGPAARYIFLDFLKKKIQKGCRCIGAKLDVLGLKDILRKTKSK